MEKVKEIENDMKLHMETAFLDLTDSAEVERASLGKNENGHHVFRDRQQSIDFIMSFLGLKSV